MAKERNETTGNAKDDSLLLKALHGRLLTTDIFARNWLTLLLLIVMVLIYITNKYQCQRSMEEIRDLTRRLEVVETERVRVRSEYMSGIRESAMQHLVDTMHLGLSVQPRPPYRLDIKHR
ncbi:MAG: hypothetical protein K2L49_01930 [Muribaculaceae bacterium]|nr:hypothetical protein [Muribaculaceae bacterium]